MCAEGSTIAWGRRRSLLGCFRAIRLLAVGLSAAVFVVGPQGAISTAATPSHIYWTNLATSRGPSGPGINAVARADLNGGDVNRDLVKAESFPGAIAVDAKHVYWANDEGETIARANLDGSHADFNFIPRPYRPVGSFQTLMVHGSRVYWTQFTSTTIGRASIDGTHVNPRFLDIGPVKRYVEVTGLAADGKHLYWSDAESGGTIGRADLDGKDVRRRFMVGVGAVGSLALYGKHLYWVNARWGTIGRSDLSGRHRIRRFVVGPPAGASIAVGAGHIYWTAGATIGRAALSGREVEPDFIFAGVEDEFGLESAASSVALGP